MVEHRWLVYHGYFELVLESLEYFSITADIYILIWDNLRALILFWKCLLCTLVRIASMRQFLLVHTTYIYFEANWLRWPNCASWPDSIINTYWLELPLSQTNFIVPKVFEPLKFDCTWTLNITSRFGDVQAGLSLRSFLMPWGAFICRALINSLQYKKKVINYA